MRKFFCVLSILMAIVQHVMAIVGAGRDLVLTPKQVQQVSGKRIYYEEQPGKASRPWEHTLKHVTYVTLFTDAAVSAASGNLSQLHDYHDFLQTPYILAASAQSQQTQSRFGDIVTLASGRLEKLSNGSYRFVEGSTDVNQVEQDVQTRALWQIQRIRHRDGDTLRFPHRYHYEMKFSVSPLTGNIGWPPQSFIQKEADYPQSFDRLVYEEKRKQAFAQRRQDRQPQATFVRSIFQQAPPPLPPNLNIGEYLKGVPEAPPKPPSKIEVFPARFNLGLRSNFIPATTFRPGYPIKLGPRLELTTPLEHYPLPNELGAGVRSAGDSAGEPGAPVTHHFHHHFYMAPGGLADASSYPELGYHPSTYVQELSTLAPPTTPPNYQQQPQNPLEIHQEVQFPTNHASSSAETLETGDDLHQSQNQYQNQGQNQNVEQRPFVRSPQLYTVFDQASKYQTSKLPPLLIYAGANPEEEQNKFVQSEPLEETVYRYSEPDPLYVHQHPVDVLQLETPNQYKSDEPLQHQQPAQLQVEQETIIEDNGQVQEVQEEQEQEQDMDPIIDLEQRPAGSQKQSKVATTAAPTSSTMGTTTTDKPTTTTSTAASTVASTTKSSFVSTSTSTTPLRALSRYRTTPRITAGRSTTTTTTQSPIPKWKQRRRDNITALDSKAKSSHRHESKVALMPTLTRTTTKTTTSTTTVLPAVENDNSAAVSKPDVASTIASAAISQREVVEVLTQKSVSKSVSIKVGENGEEIPVIVDDDENEVKRT